MNGDCGLIPHQPKPSSEFVVVFLDVDGVLHPVGENHLPLYAELESLLARNDADLDCDSNDASYVSPVVEGEFMVANMLALRTIVDATGANIVLTSTWRTNTVSRRAVEAQLILHNITAPIIGSTPILDVGYCREDEIAMYLQSHPEISSFCVLDDMELNACSNPDRGYFDSSKFIWCDPLIGLTMADAEKAIGILEACKH